MYLASFLRRASATRETTALSNTTRLVLLLVDLVHSILLEAINPSLLRLEANKSLLHSATAHKIIVPLEVRVLLAPTRLPLVLNQTRLHLDKVNLLLVLVDKQLLLSDNLNRMDLDLNLAQAVLPLGLHLDKDLKALIHLGNKRQAHLASNPTNLVDLVQHNQQQCLGPNRVGSVSLHKPMLSDNNQPLLLGNLGSLAYLDKDLNRQAPLVNNRTQVPLGNLLNPQLLLANKLALLGNKRQAHLASNLADLEQATPSDKANLLVKVHQRFNHRVLLPLSGNQVGNLHKPPMHLDNNRTQVKVHLHNHLQVHLDNLLNQQAQAHLDKHLLVVKVAHNLPLGLAREALVRLGSHNRPCSVKHKEDQYLPNAAQHQVLVWED